jgi:hypothetical protein
LHVEDGVVQRLTFVENRNHPLWVLCASDFGLAQGAGRVGGLDLADGVVVLGGGVLGEGSGLLEGEDQIDLLRREKQGAWASCLL